MKRFIRIIGKIVFLSGILNEVARWLMILKTGEDIPPDGIIWNSFVVFIGTHF